MPGAINAKGTWEKEKISIGWVHQGKLSQDNRDLYLGTI